MRRFFESTVVVMASLIGLAIVSSCESSKSNAAATEPPEVKPAVSKTAVAEPTKKAEGNSQSTATYKLTQLDEQIAKSLTGALADRECILSAKPLLAEARLVVTYRPDQCCPNSIKGALATVDPEVALEKVEQAGKKDAVKDQGSCGGCPHKESCGGKH